ncbi:MAG TPA: hypothetical protein VFZ95_07000 [Steroidobacteraceae bacterium]
MPGPSTRDLKPTRKPLASPLHPDEEEKRREEELNSLGDANRADGEHVESDEEQQARESETAFDQAITRIPPG